MCCLIVATAISAFAQDSPQWRGAGRDGKVTGFTVPDQWPTTLTQAWKTPVGVGDAGMALVGDMLYAFGRQGGDEVVTCISVADGKVVWADKNPQEAISGPDATLHSGPRACPAVADGKVVTVSVWGVVSCLDAATGKVVWRKDPFPGQTPRFHAASSPMIVDGMAIAFLGAPGAGALMAFDLNTGDEKWRWAAEGPDYGSPTVMTLDGAKQIVTFTEKSLVGVAAADGKLQWQIPFVTGRMAYNAATPLVDGSTVIYCGANRGTHAVKIAKQGDVYAATPVWDNPAVAGQFGQAVLANGLLFGVSNRANIFCLNAQTGATAWVDTVARDRSGYGCVLAAGNVLVVLPTSQILTVFSCSDKAYTQLAAIKVADSFTFAPPILAGKRIFVKDQDSVILWTLP